MTDWLPIETAPRDETKILIYFDMVSVYGNLYKTTTVGEYFNGKWWTTPYMHEINTPTHWKPLDPPPTN